MRLLYKQTEIIIYNINDYKIHIKGEKEKKIINNDLHINGDINQIDIIELSKKIDKKICTIRKYNYGVNDHILYCATRKIILQNGKLLKIKSYLT